MPRRLAQRQEICARGPGSTLAAHKFDAAVLLHLLAFAQKNQPDLARARHVCPAAGLPVEPFHLDGAQDALALHGLADARCGEFLRSAEAHRHRPVLENDLVGALLGLLQLPEINRRRRQVNRGDLASEVKGDCRMLEQLEKRRGKQVLPGVLLHVIEAALPVNGSVHRPGVELTIGDVDHCVAFTLEDVHDSSFAQRAGIVRLAA